jgi:phosphoglycolate phosphatase-like HAD superfamily hydrolase
LSVTAEDIYKYLVPSISITIEHILTAKFTYDVELVKKIENSTITLLSSEWMDRITINNGIIELLDGLLKAGNELHIVSNSHSSFFLPAIAKNKLGKYFQEIITLDTGYTDKGEMLQGLARTTGKNISNIMYIGDTMMDLELGLSVGCMVVILITRSSWDYEKSQDIAKAAIGKEQVRIIDGVQNAKIALLSE